MPHYLLYGMSPGDFWDGEVGLATAYRKKYEMQLEQENRRDDALAWLMGAYMRDALQSVYLLVNGFVPKKAEAMKYPEKPWSLKNEEQKQAQQKEETRRQNEEERIKANVAMMQVMFGRFNKNLEKRRKKAAMQAAEQEGEMSHEHRDTESTDQ